MDTMVEDTRLSTDVDAHPLVRQARARLLEQDDLPTRLRGLVAKNR